MHFRSDIVAQQEARKDELKSLLGVWGVTGNILSLGRNRMSPATRSQKYRFSLHFNLPRNIIEFINTQNVSKIRDIRVKLSSTITIRINTDFYNIY